MFDFWIFDVILLIINCQENARLQNWAHLSKLGPFPRIGECSWPSLFCQPVFFALLSIRFCINGHLDQPFSVRPPLPFLSFFLHKCRAFATTFFFIIRLFRGKVYFSQPCLFKLICRAYNFFISCRFFISIRPESDHWLCLSLTHSSHSLTD